MDKAIRQRLRELYGTLDPVALLAEMRDAQAELGTRVDRRGGAVPVVTASARQNAATFAQKLGKGLQSGEQRVIHRRRYVRKKVRARQPSMLDPHVPLIKDWLAAEPQLTAITILGRLAERFFDQFGKPQHSIVQRLLRALRAKAARQLIAGPELS